MINLFPKRVIFTAEQRALIKAAVLIGEFDSAAPDIAHQTLQLAELLPATIRKLGLVDSAGNRARVLDAMMSFVSKPSVTKLPPRSYRKFASGHFKKQRDSRKQR